MTQSNGASIASTTNNASVAKKEEESKLSLEYKAAVKQFCNQLDGHLNGRALKAALRTSYLHFQKHSNSTNLVADIFTVLMANGARAKADQIKVISKLGFGINLVWNKEAGQAKHNVDKKMRGLIDSDVTIKVMRDLANQDISLSSIYDELVKDDKPPKPEDSFTVKMEKFEKSTLKSWKKFEELGASVLNPHDATALRHTMNRIIRELEESADAIELAQQNMLETLLSSNAGTGDSITTTEEEDKAA